MKKNPGSQKLVRPLPHGTGLVAALAALIALVYSVPAATITLTPVADTTLQAAYPNSNFGGGTTFTAGGRRQGGATRALMRFDVAGNVPAGSTISSVTLTLAVVTTPSGGVNSIFDLHRLLASWGEGNGADHGGTPAGAGQASWNNRLGPGIPWTTPGGDFSATVSGSRSVTGNGHYTFAATATLVADVQSWLDTPSNNFGWLLSSESEGTPTTIRRFGSRDNVDAPSLTITYFRPATVAYTIDPTLSTLNLSGSYSGFGFQPQSSGAMSNHFSGTITGSLSRGVLSFSGGCSIIVVTLRSKEMLPPLLVNVPLSGYAGSFPNFMSLLNQ